MSYDFLERGRLSTGLYKKRSRASLGIHSLARSQAMLFLLQFPVAEREVLGCVAPDGTTHWCAWDVGKFVQNNPYTFANKLQCKRLGQLLPDLPEKLSRKKMIPTDVMQEFLDVGDTHCTVESKTISVQGVEVSEMVCRVVDSTEDGKVRFWDWLEVFQRDCAVVYGSDFTVKTLVSVTIDGSKICITGDPDLKKLAVQINDSATAYYKRIPKPI